MGLDQQHESLLKRVLAWQEEIYGDASVPGWLRLLGEQLPPDYGNGDVGRGGSSVAGVGASGGWPLRHERVPTRLSTD